MSEIPIKEALAHLDMADDKQWTTDGQPSLEAMSKIVGRKVTRAEIAQADPKFVRVKPESAPTPKPKDDLPTMEELNAAVDQAERAVAQAQAALRAAQVARDAAILADVDGDGEPDHVRQLRDRMAFAQAEAKRRGAHPGI